MSLILPNGPSFAHWSDNLTVPLGSFNHGASIVPGLSNADGSPATVLPALAHDCEYLVLSVSGFAASTLDGSALMDLLVDPAGGTSWSEMISDLLVGYSARSELDGSNPGPAGVPLMYHFPIWLPAGTSIGALARGANSAPWASPPRVIAYAAGGNKHPASWWCGQKVETVGTMDPSNSRGQAVTPGGGVGISGAADNGAGLIRLTVSSTVNMTTGDVRGVGGVSGTTEANGTWTITVVSGSTIDLQGSAFANAYVSGGAVSGRMSSWTNLGSPTSRRAGAMQFGAQGPGGGTVSGRIYRYEFGAGGQQIGPCMYRGQGSLEVGSHYSMPVFCDIPAGTQMQVRGACNSTITTGVGTDVAAYLVQ